MGEILSVRFIDSSFGETFMIIFVPKRRTTNIGKGIQLMLLFQEKFHAQYSSPKALELTPEL